MVKRFYQDQLAMTLFPDAAGNQSKLEIQFWAFHKANPRVYSLLKQFAVEWRKRRGKAAKLGIKALFKRVRWEISLGKIKEDFKLNNNNTAFYARLLMRDEPILKDIFNVRKQRIQSTLGPPNDTLPASDQVTE